MNKSQNSLSILFFSVNCKIYDKKCRRGALAQHEKVRSGSDVLEGGYAVQIVSKVGMNLG